VKFTFDWSCTRHRIILLLQLTFKSFYVPATTQLPRLGSFRTFIALWLYRLLHLRAVRYWSRLSALYPLLWLGKCVLTVLWFNIEIGNVKLLTTLIVMWWLLIEWGLTSRLRVLRLSACYYNVGQNVLVPCLQGTAHLILLLAMKVTWRLLIILCIIPGVSLYPHLYSVILLGLRSQ